MRKAHIVKRPFPLPEALPGERGGQWHIDGHSGRVSHGKTSLTEKSMLVPIADTVEARNVRSHELGHAAYSYGEPDKLAAKWGIETDAILVAEDYRINSLLVEFGPREFRLGMLSEQEVKAIETNTVNELALIEKSVPKGLQAEARGKVGAKLMAALTSILPVRADYHKVESVLALIPEVGPILTALGQELNKVYNTYSSRRWRADKTRQRGLALKAMRDMARLVQAAMNVLDPPPKKEKEPTYMEGSMIWGDMEIQRPPLLAPRRGLRLAAPRRVSRDEGMRIRGLHRVWTDNKVFRVKQHKHLPGGTVLIDASGSMRWEAGDIEKILKAAPAATVAFYEGGVNSQLRRATDAYDLNIGRLVVIAQKGRMAGPARMRALVGANVVDGPALDWLGQQAEPRYWVSDGKVTGRGETRNALLTLDAAGKVKRGRIKTLPNMAATFKEFGVKEGGKVA